MKNAFVASALFLLFASTALCTAAAAEIYRPYFLASDVEPCVFVGQEVFFLRAWGGNAPSTSFVQLYTVDGARYCGRLVKISDYEIAVSLGYVIKKTGQRVEKQSVVPKKNIVIARIFW
ncbi:MAG: hypothetical protein V2A71_05330 [Candidatus Eisenbacteria bacterium]